MKTRADLVRAAYEVLVGAGAGQDVSPEDYLKVDGAVDGAVAELARRSVVYVPDVEAIDDELLESLAVVVAMRPSLTGPFGTTVDPSAMMWAESRLREMQPQVQTRQPVWAEYF